MHVPVNSSSLLFFDAPPRVLYKALFSDNLVDNDDDDWLRVPNLFIEERRQ